jgi:hypothetical protein
MKTQNTNTELSLNLLRRLALMQHYEGNLDDLTTEWIEATENLPDAQSWDEFVNDNCSEVEELDIDDCYDVDYYVLTDSEADEKAAEYIKDSLWAFNASFIIEHSKLPYEAKEMVQSFQSVKCESANDTIEALIEDMNEFVQDAIRADGRGHFLSSYDGNENEEIVTLPEGITTEQMEETDIDTNTTFYIYRIN